jgi:FkbM family methyltransferase
MNAPFGGVVLIACHTPARRRPAAPPAVTAPQDSSARPVDGRALPYHAGVLRAWLRRRAPRLAIDQPERVTREHVLWAYRLFLDRNPENETVVRGKAKAFATTRQLRAEFLTSYEFRQKNPDLAAANEPSVVIKELPDGGRIFVDLADHAIGLAIARGRYEPDEAELVRRVVRPGQVALDLGANIGYFTILLAGLVGPTGRVYAFEPLERNAVLLDRSVRENRFEERVVLVRAAVGERGGRAQLLAVRDGLNSGTAFLSDDPPGAWLGYDAHVVPVVALDEYEFAGRLGFVKMDVEGAERLAVRGARARLRSDRPVLLAELNPVQLRRVSGCGVTELVAEVEELGYVAHRLAGGRLEPGVPPPGDFELGSVVFLPAS